MMKSVGLLRRNCGGRLDTSLCVVKIAMFEFCLAGRRFRPQIWNHGAASRKGLIPAKE